MRLSERGILKNTDWVMVGCYLVLILIGWMNIYASVHSSEPSSIFDFEYRCGKQFVWIVTALGLAGLIMFVFSPRIYEDLSLPIYLLTILLLIAVIFLGTEVKGSRSWFTFGPIRFQPAEISKIATSLLLARIMSQFGYSIKKISDFILTAAVILIPMAIIVAQSETGSALVYVGFIFMLYREGLSGWFIFIIGVTIALFILTLTMSPTVALLALLWIVTVCEALYNGNIVRRLKTVFPVLVLLTAMPFALEYAGDTIKTAINPDYIIIGVSALCIPLVLFYAYRQRSYFAVLALAATIAGMLFIFSSDFIFDNVLQEHQRKRIEVLLGMKDDPSGVGYNVRQSMIAIGSGGLFGKGYLHGTQTTYGFVPEQSTDFIFCTIGEEWGFIGSASLIILYVFLIMRIINRAEQSKEAFTRIYGYCVACCIFMHLFINIGMTMGLMPVIGIPLPFISYGGSSLWGFTVLLFIFIALDCNERRR